MNLRRVVLALVVLSLFVGLASAQTIINGAMTCAVSASAAPTVRSEGKTELVGDAIITCSGGIGQAITSNVAPGVDITVSYGTPITSRQAANTAGTAIYSDAMLVIDDPNSVSSTNTVVPGFGLNAPLTICQPNIPGSAGSVNAACPTYPVRVTTASNGSYWVAASTAGGTTTAANAYQGVVSGNSVTFYGVPLISPVDAGVYRRFRVVNVRVAPGSSTISATITAAGVNAPQLAITGGTSVTVATGQGGFTYSTSVVTGQSNVAQYFQQCLPPVVLGTTTGAPLPYVALLKFAANFNNATKPEGLAIPAQYTYGSYPNESGIVVPAGALAAIGTAAGTNANIGGAADAGTRFKAVFSGLPTGKNAPKVYVSLNNVSDLKTDGSGGSASATGTAQGSGTNVAILSEGGGTTVGPAAVEFAPWASAAGVTGNTPVNGNGFTNDPVAIPLTVGTDGTATAVWEVKAASSKPTLMFGVYIQYTNAVGTTTTPTVALSVAPIAPPATAAVQIPQFAATPTSGPLFVITPCQTTLLFPFVSNVRASATAAWETGIAIANTGLDPWATVTAAGVSTTSPPTCTLNFFGPNAPPVMTTPQILPGAYYSFVISDPLQTGTATLTNFQGYLFAVCNFSFGHGFAFVEDDTRSMAMGYLADVVTGTNGRAITLTGESLGQ